MIVTGISGALMNVKYCNFGDENFNNWVLRRGIS